MSATKIVLTHNYPLCGCSIIISSSADASAAIAKFQLKDLINTSRAYAYHMKRSTHASLIIIKHKSTHLFRMRRLLRFQGGQDVHALRRRDLAVSLGTVADQQHPDDHHHKGGAA